MLCDETEVVLLMEDILWKVAADTRSTSPVTSSSSKFSLQDDVWSHLISDTGTAVRSESPADSDSSLISVPAHVAELVFDIVTAVVHSAGSSPVSDDATAPVESDHETEISDGEGDEQVTTDADQVSDKVTGEQQVPEQNQGEEDLTIGPVRDTGSAVNQCEEPDEGDDDPGLLIAAGCVTMTEPEVDADQFGLVCDEDDCSPTGGSDDDLQIVCTQRQGFGHNIRHNERADEPDEGLGAGGDVRHKPVTPVKSLACAVRYQMDESDQVEEQDDGVQDEQENRNPSPSDPASGAAGTAIRSVTRTGYGPGLSRRLPIRRPLHQHLYQEEMSQLIREHDAQRKRQRKEELQRMRKQKHKRFLKYEFEPVVDWAADMSGTDDDDMEVDDDD